MELEVNSYLIFDDENDVGFLADDAPLEIGVCQRARLEQCVIIDNLDEFILQNITAISRPFLPRNPSQLPQRPGSSFPSSFVFFIVCVIVCNRKKKKATSFSLT